MKIKNKKEFVAKEPVEWSVGGKLLRGSIQGKERFWLNHLSRVLAAGKPG